MMYGVLYLAFFLASGILTPVTIQFLLSDAHTKWKPVVAGLFASIVILSFEL